MSLVDEYNCELEVTSRMKEITYKGDGMFILDLSAEETDGYKIVITPFDGTNTVCISTYKYIA